MKKIKPLLKPKTIIPALFILVLIAAALLVGYQQHVKTTSTDAEKEVLGLVSTIGKIIDLPNETPTVATVSDKTKLVGQPFFLRSENGDKVLIYTKAKKAILFRPATGKIIEVAPLNLGQSNTSTTTAAATPSRTRLALYNGTTTAGLTKKIESQLGKYPNIEVVVKENASKSTYDKTIVIDLTGKNKVNADVLAKELGGKTGSLPSGEETPAADILIILGPQN